ncbi:nucleotide-diphospho-sugar transferase [Xylaria castorea]|nr:nucleotide-diphospho-sugar transferase [Xylaria castorea]
MELAELFLLENLIWEFAERRLSGKYIQQYKPFPLPSEDARLFNAFDVSIIIPTVGWDPASFSRALISMLVNRPLEIIIVTINSERQQATDFLASARIRAANTGTAITVLSIPRPNKRDQIVQGIRESIGTIIALADDDVLWNPHTLQHLLAPFQLSDVGLVSGPIESYLPEDRQDASVITSYEVAALRNRSKRRGGNKAFFVRDGSTNFTVSGATMLLRAAVVQDPEFQNAFTRETFAGVRQNSGDDAFITRWVLFQHLRKDRQGVRKWRLGMQLTPEAAVSTTLMTDSKFVSQMKRWLRTGLRFRLTCIFRDPGLRNFWRTTPYMCRKMVEGLYNPLFNIIWYVAFFLTLRRRPIMALLIALYYSRRKIWAAIIADKISLFSDFYCWATLASESWTSRQGVDDVGKGEGVAQGTIN